MQSASERERDQQHWLQLLRSRGLSVALKRRLVGALGGVRAVVQADAETLGAVLNDADSAELANSKRKPSARALRALERVSCDNPQVEKDVAMLQEIGGQFIGFTEPDFPPLLNHIQNPPLGLFILSADADARALLKIPQVAIVGSRRPTPAGRRTTEQFATQLCEAGLAITSGLATGIDGCAHRGALDAGGKTIAVMATGIDAVYPPSHQDLAREIAEHGLLVSEHPPDTPPRREFFPQRNRIISGLAFGTLVVEAGIRSGSLITARLAGEQGREVFAVPGSIHMEVSRGCHQLLREGAKLVENGDDILAELGQWFAEYEQVACAEQATPSKINGKAKAKPKSKTARATSPKSTSVRARKTATKTATKSTTESTTESTAKVTATKTTRAKGEDKPAGKAISASKSQPKSKPTASSALSKDASHLYNLIDFTPASADQLITESGLTADQVSYILMQLELGGWIAAYEDGYQRLPQ